MPLRPAGAASRPNVYISDVLERYGSCRPFLTKTEFVELVQSGDKGACSLVQRLATPFPKRCVPGEVLLDLDKIVIGGIWGQMDKGSHRTNLQALTPRS